MTAKPSALVVDTGVAVVALLGRNPRSKAFLSVETGTSQVTVQRVLEWLRNECGAPLNFDREHLAWCIAEDWRIPARNLPGWALMDDLELLTPGKDPRDELERLLDEEKGRAWRCVRVAPSSIWSRIAHGLRWHIRMSYAQPRCQWLTAYNMNNEPSVTWDSLAAEIGKVSDEVLHAWADYQIALHRDEALAACGMPKHPSG